MIYEFKQNGMVLHESECKLFGFVWNFNLLNLLAQIIVIWLVLFDVQTINSFALL